jgi:hypothetical protein
LKLSKMSSLNIDAPGFNAKAYFKTFIKDKTVEEVVTQNNKLSHGKSEYLISVTRHQAP